LLAGEDCRLAKGVRLSNRLKQKDVGCSKGLNCIEPWWNPPENVGQTAERQREQQQVAGHSEKSYLGGAEKPPLSMRWP
jgi:hypothetical protein